MSYLEIILPFGIPPSSLAKDLVRQMRAPALATLLSTSTQIKHRYFDEFARQLPHEFWITKHFTQHHIANSPASTHLRMRDFSLLPDDGFWFTLSPVHIHIARDHLVMTDQRRLVITKEESQALFEIAKPICEELGKTLIYGDEKTWFLRADAWSELLTSSIDAAAGHNMDIWIAKGEHEVAWRKLQNEIQMAWHIDAVNQTREASGIDTINSVWLHNGSASLQTLRCDTNFISFQAVLDDIAQSDKPMKAVMVDKLLEPALNSDWGHWLAVLNQLEIELFAPALHALQANKIKEIKLVFTDEQSLSEVTCRSPQAWKFWIKPSLQKLLSMPQSNNKNIVK